MQPTFQEHLTFLLTQNKELSLLESGIPSTPKKPRTRKPSSKKSAASPTPPPHVLKQKEKAIALLNQQ